MRALMLSLLMPILTSCAMAADEVIPKEPGMYPCTLETESGFDLRYTVGVPAGCDPKSPVPLVLVLHYGFDPSKPFPEYYGREILTGLVGPGLGESGAVFVAPDSHGMRWTEPKIREAVLDLMDACLEEEVIDQDRTLLVGFSMGAEGAWGLLADSSDYFDAAIIMAGPVPLDSLSKAEKVPVCVIHGTKDELFPIKAVSEALESLQKQGWVVQFGVVEGATHHDAKAYVPALEKALPWVKEQWAKKVKTEAEK